MGKRFRNDYCELAHPFILKALMEHSGEQNEAYGLDVHSRKAAQYIKDAFGAPSAEVHFLAGGTQTNLLLISKALRHFEGVISADTGHINVHETAAVEGSGYKIITIPNINGKITAKQIEEKVASFNDDEHMVRPRMVYISNSTELGTIYTESELAEICGVCKKLNLYFFIDGARLGSALTSSENDLKPSALGKLCDAFYVGGTKNGLLFGEALVINNPELAKDFRRHIKNKGAMLSKGYAVGIQFEAAFENGLYFELAKKANVMADLIKKGFKEFGIDILPSPTNQIFATFEKETALLYIKTFGCELWEDHGEKLTIRFVTSFLTEEPDVNELLEFASSHRK